MNGLRDRFDEAFRDEATQTVDDLDGESLEDVFGGGDLNQVAIAETQSRMEWVLPQIADSTKGELRETIHEGLDEGIQSRELARRVDDKFGEFSRVRANNIARTEMLSASSAGTHAAHRNSNVVKFRSWLSNRDNDVRPEHATLDQITSQDPIPVDQPFQVAGASAMHPGDFGVARLDCQCRCDTVAEFPDQRQRTEAERTKIWKRYAKRLDERERATRAVVRAAFEQQRERVLERFADEFNVDLEAVA